MERECLILGLLLFFIRFSNQCQTNEFSCKDGNCLPGDRVCDGSFDCSDGDDENNCEDNMKCMSPTWFQCKNGQCISSLMYCNGDLDCSDHSDEPENCTGGDHIFRTHSTTCAPDEFTCLNKECIRNTWLCDGDPDCLDSSDETIGCGSKMNCHGGFRCENNHCIFQEFYCDGEDDCGDNSDEVNCTMKFHSVEHCNRELGLFLCNDKIVCLGMEHVCDGFPHCFDKSDEFNCALDQKLNATYCKSSGCSHDCHLAPNKDVFCTCPSGYKLDGSLKNCIDINECGEFGYCYQKCQNSEGSHQCFCDDGYVLMSDRKTCRAKGGEALLLFSSFNQIRGLYLKSKVYFSVSTQKNRVIGISHNGKHIYWTEINREEAAIVRSNEDGSERVVIADSGLGLPEDVAVDYITGNIYFTDGEKKHIGVCSESALCTILHNEDIDKPRAIALYPQKGIMFWTDWGKTPKIATSGMDGSYPNVLVGSNIEWPNGLALDVSNDRLYWVDAKAVHIESIRLDGSDRQIVLKEAVKHPFSISVFEDMLYWSDWDNVQIEKCNKFTGKNHSSLIKEKRSRDEKNKYAIYGVHIYHPVLHPRAENPCLGHACSDLCLLSPNNTYKCACQQDFTLSSNLHICMRRSKTLQVAVAGKTHLHYNFPLLLGKQNETRINLADYIDTISCMTYDSLSGNILISDTGKKKIFRHNLQTKHTSVLISSGIGKVTSMSFDSYGNNLYFCDEERHLVEVLSLSTKYSLAVYKTYNGDIPQSIAVIPDHGVLFVAVAASEGSIFINRVNMDGTQIMPHITGSKLMGPKVLLSYDNKLQKLFWSDSGREIIESMNIDGSHREVIQMTEGTPISLACQDGVLMWINQNSPNFYSYVVTNKTERSLNGKNIFKMNVGSDSPLSITPVTEIVSRTLHPCQNDLKRGCSHLCLISHNNHGICACPQGMHLSNNITCVSPPYCNDNQFRCRADDICISRIQRCDGHKDCTSGEDEKDCEIDNCKSNQFKCANGQCIASTERCDQEFDCSDHSDEVNCPYHCDGKGEYFQCGSGECIPKIWECDFSKDCVDGSDEHSCKAKTCANDMFLCKSGMCIPKGWECDGDIDCSDASDEHENCETTTCGPMEFLCGNARCVSAQFICNGENDCGDESDELNCRNPEKESDCTFDEFLCSKANPKCVPLKSRCNGTAECPRGEDETDCVNCLPGEFQCKNFKCIYKQWLCDKENDCGDNSDEDPALCSRSLGSAGFVQPCLDFSCNSGECLPMHLVCNGQKDCEDGSDEGRGCETTCKSSPCDQICIPTPVSARCDCNSGFSLSSNGHSCIDIDECAAEKCSQICLNTPGGFNCSCVDDFLLKSDRMTCKAKGSPMSFILGGYDEIRKVSYNFNKMDLLVLDPGAQILGLDVDTRKNQIYWSSGSSNKISVMDLASGQRTFLEDVSHPGKLSYDWLTGNVYYIDVSSPNRIKACNLASRKHSTILTAMPGIIISDLVVEPVSGVIFYSQVRASALQRPISEILSYSFSKQNSTVIVSSDISWVSGLVVDGIRRFLYWSDLYNQVIEKVRYDGGQRQLIFQEQVYRPESLVFFEDSLVWLTRGSGQIKKCLLYGENKGHCDTIFLYIHDIRLLTIMQQARQPNMTVNCSDGCDVSSLCVSTSSGPRCLCEDGVVLSPNEICDLSNARSFSESRSSFDDAKQFLTYQKQPLSGNSSAVIAIFAMALIICGIFASYLYIKKRKSNVLLETRHFQNPSFGLSQLENSYHNELVPGAHQYENPATKIVQNSDGKFGVMFKSRENERKEKLEYDSDSDSYDRTDMKANLIR